MTFYTGRENTTTTFLFFLNLAEKVAWDFLTNQRRSGKTR